MQTKDKLAKMEHVKIAHDHVDFTDRIKKGTGTGALITGDIEHNTAVMDYAHAEGSYTAASEKYSHAEGRNSEASGESSHAEGNGTTASGSSSHAEGGNTTAYGAYSHAEGYGTTASGYYSHTEGYSTISSGYQSHSEGFGSEASKTGAHAEGFHATASQDGAHAEGNNTIASGYYAHAEGGNATASGRQAHAEGDNTVASGGYSHAEGYHTVAAKSCQHVSGKYNVEDTDSSVYGAYAEIIGNGTGNNNRSNARTLDWSGNEVLAGKLTVGAGPTNNMDAATKQYVDGITPASLGFGYVNCDTAANVSSKVGHVWTYNGDTFVPKEGGIILVEFLYDVPANSTLNIDNTGAFPIYIGDRNIQSGEINGYNVVSLMYSLYYEDEPKWLVMSIHDYSPNS